MAFAGQNNNSVQRIFDPGRFFTSSAPQFDPESTTLANLSYSNWQEAAQLQYPAEQQLLQYAENPAFVKDLQAQSAQGFQTQMANQTSARGRFYASQGITLTPAQQAAVSKSDALSQAEGKAGAMNAATGLAAQVQQAALQG